MCLASTGFSSVLDKRPGQKPVPEQTQAQVAEQQKLQGTFAEVGVVEMDTEPNNYVSGGTDSAAAGVVAGAESTLGGHGPADAAALVAKAGSEIRKDKAGPLGTFAWGLLLLGLGFCAVLGLRQWVVKSIPELATPKNPVEW